jgi:tetratricopeptide (TPR) repeat protein
MRRPLPSILVALLTFAISLGVFAVLSGREEGASARSTAAATGAELTAGATGDQRIAVLQRLVRADQGGAAIATQLGEAYLQKARETSDPAFLSRAEAVFERARRAARRDPGPLVGLGTLALARHEFRTALDFGRRARRLEPEVVRPYAVLVDAQVELGRYRDAARSLQRMVDLKPNLASYARVSYFRELHGDLDGAVEAMRLAVSAGGDSPESVAYVQTLLGNLEFSRGRLRAAGAAYATALARLPDYVPALASRARLDASRGRLARAIKSLDVVTQRLPLPEHVIAKGEAELARGDRAAARESFALVRAERQLLESSGVNTDVEFALFEADHGDRRRGVQLGRRAFAAAPSVRSADALSWALTRAGRPREGLRYARRALALGSREPLFLAHAGLTARAAGRPDLARRWLRRSLADNPRFSALWAPRARRALRSVSA